MTFLRTRAYTLRATPGESDGGRTRCRRAVHAAQNAAGMLVIASSA
jgi:hypothetical protein